LEVTTISDPADRAQTPLVGDEQTLLLRMLAFQRDTLRWKCSGLTPEQLAYQHEPSALSLGGLLKHLAVVEAGWVNLTFAGGHEPPSWMSQETEGEDWTFSTAAADSPEQLFARRGESQRVTELVVAETSTLDALSQNTPWGEACSLRWILLHLVQEYGRHLGHVDLIREAVDGTTGI
jgi:uncharacterized damage-inducible protein DinB